MVVVVVVVGLVMERRFVCRVAYKRNGLIIESPRFTQLQ